MVACLLVATLVAWPAALQADQAQYFYDELGRLVGMVDGQGNMAVYNYDAIGNLVSIIQVSMNEELVRSGSFPGPEERV